MEVRVRHGLSVPELVQRIRAAADRHDVEFTPGADETRGTLGKNAGFLGEVRAEYAIEPDALVVTVTKRPAFLPEGTLRRMLEDELGKLVAS
jgi:hypothetical protein